MKSPDKVTVYIGFDSSNLGQEIAYKVCHRSIRKHNSDINIVPLKLSELRNSGFIREHDNKQSTEFTYTRFLAPYLNNYEGYAIFCDSDFVWECDVTNTLQYVNGDKSVACVHHKYVECNSSVKMDGLKQEWYPRKNWSSLMVFNCEHKDCSNLDLNAINTKSPKYLHRMEWTSDEYIGSIPIEYNYLVGYYSFTDNPKALHFTDGGPWHHDYVNTEYADKWTQYLTEDEIDQFKNGEFWK